MNERIKELLDQAQGSIDPMDLNANVFDRFAELIINECIQVCNQEWYELNNSSKEDLDDRGIAIHVGQKAGVLKVQQRIKEHFGVES